MKLKQTNKQTNKQKQKQKHTQKQNKTKQKTKQKQNKTKKKPPLYEVQNLGLRHVVISFQVAPSDTNHQLAF